MFIQKIQISKFRGFKNVSFELGELLTVIAGQNGTQKTTLLGMLSQPFTITAKNNLMKSEKPLCGGNFRSAFAEKFKLSPRYDKPKSHEWTLHLNHCEDTVYTAESIKRNGPERIRFWKKGDRSKGSGYIQLPTIFLSLSRLFPIGEDDAIGTSRSVKLTDDEFEFYQDWHNKILIIPDIEMTSVAYLESNQKNTLGANTNYYDWHMNSAGQDNIGKIILAILSFERLQSKYKNDYKGGILAIDELDATLYPAAQLKLIDFLRKYASKLKIQIIFTTHSTTILKKCCEMQDNLKLGNQIKIVFLKSKGKVIQAIDSAKFSTIKDNLDVTISEEAPQNKIRVFTEDAEATIFLKGIIKRSYGQLLEIVSCHLGCDNLKDLVRKKIPGFRFPECLIVLDGDAKRIPSTSNNIIKLPGNQSPEQLFADFLYNNDSENTIWDTLKDGYSKQVCFRDYSYKDIMKTREKAKEWFNQQKQYWGSGCRRLINAWMNENEKECDEFLKLLQMTVDKFKKALLI